MVGGGARSSSFSFPKEEEESAVGTIMPPRNMIEIRIPQTARGVNKDLEDLQDQHQSIMLNNKSV